MPILRAAGKTSAPQIRAAYRLLTWLTALAASMALTACGGRDSGHDPTPLYRIGGSINGLTGSGLVLRNNGGDDLTIAANASAFTFATLIAYGGIYSVTVATQPAGQVCAIAHASGAAKATVGDVAITCSDVRFTRFDGHSAIISDERVAQDAAGGNALYFIFVDNTNAATADGSYQHPYPTLAQAQANSAPDQFIYVLPGDGTTTGMDAGIALQARQKLWGAGTAHVLQTSAGNVEIPAGVAIPKITNNAGAGVALATDNDVSGFVLPAGAGYDYGIVGINPGSVKISDCSIDNTQDDQIHLEYSGSAGSIALDKLTLRNGAAHGIFIDATTASAAIDFALSNSAIENSAARSIEASFANAATVQLTHNTFSGNSSGNAFTFAAAATLSATDNTFANNTSVSDAPLIVSAAAAPLAGTIENNTFSDNTAGSLLFVLNDTAATLSINHNAISNNGTGALSSLGSSVVINPNGSSNSDLNLVMNDNTFSANAGNALFIFSGQFDDVQVSAADNAITGNGGGGMVFGNGANTFALTAINNTISGGGDHGIATAGGLALTTAHITLTDNRIDNNANFASGVALSHTGNMLYLTATGNEISNNETSGIVLYASSAIANVVASIKDNTIANNLNLSSNAAGGIDLEQFTNLSADLENNHLESNTGSDVFIGSTEPSPSACLMLTGNSSNMGYMLSNASGIFNLAPSNAAAVNSGTILTSGAIGSVPSCP